MSSENAKEFVDNLYSEGLHVTKRGRRLIEKEFALSTGTHSMNTNQKIELGRAILSNMPVTIIRMRKLMKDDHSDSVYIDRANIALHKIKELENPKIIKETK